MLQQTRVEVVAPRFDAFLRRWPTPEAMAASAEDEVVAAWSGLGYYGRARRLHACSVVLTEGHGGRFPADAESLGALPGLGPYTAGAVGSLSLGMRLSLVDGNVARVLSRLFAVRGDPRAGKPARRIRELAESLLPPRAAGAWNEGLMELGALVCVPGRPNCAGCPLSADCAARKAGIEEQLPEVGPQKKPRPLRLVAALIRDARGRVLLLRRPAGGQMGGMYEPPTAEAGEGENPVEVLRAALRARLGGRWRFGPVRARIRHSILDRRILLEAHEVAGTIGKRRIPGLLWCPARDLLALPLSSLVTKTLAAASRGAVSSDRGGRRP